MRVSLTILALSSALALGCAAAKTASTGGTLAGVTGAAAAMEMAARAMPQDAPELLTQGDDHASPSLTERPPRPINPDLLAERAKLQSLRINTILGKQRALMHNPELDKMRQALLANRPAIASK
jgi:hypothetical protein